MKNSARIMFVFGLIAFAAIMIVVSKKSLDMSSAEFWFYRVLVALAAASISISIPGMLEIRYDNNKSGMQLLTDASGNPEPTNLAEREPAITASGAIAVFVMVYLFNPIG